MLSWSASGMFMISFILELASQFLKKKEKESEEEEKEEEEEDDRPQDPGETKQEILKGD